MIQTLIQAFQTGGLALTAEEIADVIWLAAQIDLPAADHSPAEVKPDEHDTEVDRPPTMPGNQQPEPDGRTGAGADAVQRPAETEVHLPKSAPSRSGEVAGVRAVSFHVPAATALPGKLALARRLRPLLRRVPALTHWVLDEASTAQRAAQERMITPVLQPGQARWLDLMVVVDDWQTMASWRQTVDEWIELLQQIGAFRTVQTYRLTTALVQQSSGDESAQLYLYATQGSSGKRGRACDRRELIDPNGRRLILVLTDCTSPAWYNGAAGRLLALWGQSNIVTLVQMLPADLWDSCALAHAIQVSLSASAPGLPNHKLDIEFPWYWTELEEEKPAGLPVPVITLEPEAIDAWAKVLTGKGRVKAPGFCLPLQPVTSEESGLTPELTPEERWQRFRAWASPMARELAGYLSAAPLSLPVMRLVQRMMLPQSRQVHLAEVLRSGLVQQVMPFDAAVDPDEIRYDFVDGVRKLLLTTVLISDTKKVLEKVSEYISNHNYQLRNFHALILDPTSSGKFDIDENTMPVAVVTSTVLKRLGGEHAQLAKRLENYIRAQIKQTDLSNRIIEKQHSILQVKSDRRRDFKSFIVGRQAEIKMFDDLLNYRTEYRLLNIYGPSGIGKTVVAQMFENHARLYGVPVTIVDGLRPDLTPDRILYAFKEGLVQESAGEAIQSAFQEFDRQFQDYLVVNQVLQQGGGIQALFDVVGNVKEPTGLAAILSSLGEAVSETAKRTVSNRFALERYLRGAERTLTASFIEGLNTSLMNLHSPIVLLIDTYEEMEGLDDWVCRTLVPRLPNEVCMVILGNDQLPKINFDWNEHEENVHALPLPELEEVDAKSYLRHYGLADGVALDKVYQFTGGYPLLLVLVRHLAREAGGWEKMGTLESSADRDRVATQLLERILRQESVAEVQAFLEKGVVARWFDPETVSVILEVNLADARSIYDKLQRHSFVERHPYGLKFHDKIRELLVERLKFTHEHDYNRLTKRLMDYYAEKAGKEEEQKRESDTPLPLTRRQMEVLHYLASGMSDSAIAEALHIAEGAVRGHISNIKKRLQLRYRWQVIDEARRRGLVGNSSEA